MHVNVVENVSKYFGTNHWSFYLHEIPEFILELDGWNTALFGFCLITVVQMNNNKVPHFILFSIATIAVLTGIGHKEQRFMTAVFPLFLIGWGYLWVWVTKLVPMVKKVFRLIFLYFMAIEIKMTMKHHLNKSPGDKEIYTLLHERS